MIKLFLRKWGIIPKPIKDIRKPATLPSYVLKIEAAVVLLTSLFIYFFLLKGGTISGIILFIIFLLVPDLSLSAYYFGLRTGAVAFNLAHTYAFPALLLGLAFLLGIPILTKISVVWFVHISQDRLRGAGLKYATEFHESHLHKV